MATPPSMFSVWAINIVGHAILPAKDFLANEKNFRIHPRAQSDATRGSLNELGWVKSVTINKRTDPAWGADRGVETVLDGHDRIKLSLQVSEDTPVPVEYVDLTPEKEDLALLILDEITTQATKDREKFARLLGGAKTGESALAQMFSLMAQQEGLAPPDVTFKEYDESVASEVEWHECPNCGHRWPK